MAEDMLTVLGGDLVIVHRLLGLGVDPADVRLPLDLAVKVLDQTHDPRHLDVPFHAELALVLHLPARAGAAPGPQLRVADDHDRAPEVGHAQEIREVLDGFRVVFQLGIPHCQVRPFPRGRDGLLALLFRRAVQDQALLRLLGH